MKKVTTLVCVIFWCIMAVVSPLQAKKNELKLLNQRVIKLYKAGKYTKAIPLAIEYMERVQARYGKNHKNFSTSLNNLALLYQAQGRYTEAEKLFKRSLVVKEKAIGANHRSVAISLNNLAGLYQDQGLYTKAEMFYKRSLVILKKVLGSSHQDVAINLTNLAGTYRSQGRYAEAEPLYKRAMVIKEKALGSNHPDVATSLDHLAVLYYLQGRYDDAEPLSKRSLTIKEKKLGSSHPLVGNSLNNLALLYQSWGRYIDAEPLYKRSLSIWEKVLGSNHPNVAMSLGNLAELYRLQGRYAYAEPFYARSLAIREKTLGDNHPLVATSLNNFAILYRQLGRYADAAAYYKRALIIREKVLGPNHQDVAISLINLAQLFSSQGQYTEAVPLIERSLLILEKAYGSEHPNLAIGLNNLAEIYRKTGRYIEAEANFKRSLPILKKKLGVVHPTVGINLGNIGLMYLSQGRYANAESNLNQSLAILEEAVGPNHPAVGRGRNNLAALYYAMGQYTLAYKNFLRGNEIFIKRSAFGAVSDSGSMQGHFDKKISEAQQNKASLIAQVKTAYLISKETVQADLTLSDKAFRTAQWSVGSVAAKALAQMSARFASGSSKLAGIVRKRQDMIQLWRKKDTALIAALSAASRKHNSKKLKAIRESLKATEKEILELTVILKKQFPEFSNLANPKPLSLLAVQKQLREDEALLMFLPGNDWGVVWSITKQRVNWIKINISKKTLSKKITTLRAALNIDNIRDDKAEMFNLQNSYELYKSIFPPEIESAISNKKKLLIVTGSTLSSLPFNLLVTNKPSLPIPAEIADYKEAAWLVKRHSLVLLPSVSSLKALRQFAKRGLATKPLVGFANPDFGRSENANIARGQNVTAMLGLSFKSYYRGGIVDTKLLGQSLPQLPDTEYELKTVAQKLGVPASDIILGRDASETRLKKMKLRDYKIVYFATHALVAGDLEHLGVKDKAEPALVLSVPANGTLLDDGLLTASEVALLKLNADWVVLSACNTAAGNKPGAEALSGLARAFFYSGARSLLVSHWPVVSDAAVKLTTQLFELKADNPELDKAEALRKSMLSLMNDTSDPLNAYPAMWAPFIIVGE